MENSFLLLFFPKPLKQNADTEDLTLSTISGTPVCTLLVTALPSIPSFLYCINDMLCNGQDKRKNKTPHKQRTVLFDWVNSVPWYLGRPTTSYGTSNMALLAGQGKVTVLLYTAVVQPQLEYCVQFEHRIQKEHKPITDCPKDGYEDGKGSGGQVCEEWLRPSRLFILEQRMLRKSRGSTEHW